MAGRSRIAQVVAAALFAGPAIAATPTAAISCSSCVHVADMQTAAATWANQNAAPQSTQVVVVGLNNDMTAIYTIGWSYTGHGLYRAHATPVTLTDAAALALDNVMFARRMKIPPINITIPITSSTDDAIDLSLMNILKYTGVCLMNTIGSCLGGSSGWYQLQDTQTGTMVKAFPGDMITVKDQDGYSEKWEFQGVPPIGCPVNGPCQWSRVPGTRMFYDKPAKVPSTTSATPLPNYGSMSSNITLPSGWINVTLDPHLCYGTSEVAVTAPDGSSAVGVGNFSAGCP